MTGTHSPDPSPAGGEAADDGDGLALGAAVGRGTVLPLPLPLPLPPLPLPPDPRRVVLGAGVFGSSGIVVPAGANGDGDATRVGPPAAADGVTASPGSTLIPLSSEDVAEGRTPGSAGPAPLERPPPLSSPGG